MFCKTCGRQIENDCTFCSFCGAKQSSEVRPQPQEGTTTPFNPTEEANKNEANFNASPNKSQLPKYDPKYKKEGNALIVGIFLVIAALIFAVIGPIRFENKESYEHTRAVAAVLSLILRIFITVWVVNIAKRQNRNTFGWGLFAFILPSIALIIIATRKKLFVDVGIEDRLGSLRSSEMKSDESHESSERGWLSMRPTIQYAILFAIIWFLGKLAFFYTQTFQAPWEVKYLVLWNMLCLLLSITIGSYIQKRREANTETTALYDMKNSMAGGLVYSIIVGALIYIYYAKIDPGYNARQLHAAEVAIKKAIDDPKQLAQIRKNPEMATMTTDEIYKQAITNQQAIYSPGSTTTVSLLGMLLLSTLNALVVSVVYRRIVFRRD